MKISLDRLRDVLHYDAETGDFIWKKKLSNSSRIGDVAGATEPDGYRILSIDGRSYRAHRLVWYYIYGSEAPFEIDHIDGDRSNNRLSNLRLATKSQNRKNTKRHRDNKSGFKGVVFQKHTKKNPWRSVITYGGKSHHLGNFPTPEDAHAAYVRAARSTFGEFARAE